MWKRSRKPYGTRSCEDKFARNDNTDGFEDYSEEFCSGPLAFYYMAGVEVDKDTVLPEDVYRKVVPKAKYAVFTVNGNNANGEIGMAFQYIYHVWLPNSEYCIDENALFDFEYYDERWDCQFGAAQMDIYLRQHEPEKDARPFWEIYYDEENFSYFGGYRRPHDWNEEREIRAEQSRIKGFKGKREYSWVVTYQGKVIGQIQLFNFFNSNTCAEVGYFIKKSYWNRGINTKVLKAVCRFCERRKAAKKV